MNTLLVGCRASLSSRPHLLSTTAAAAATAATATVDPPVSPPHLPHSHQAKEILQEESNVQPVACPVTICGDIHGQVRCRGVWRGGVSGVHACVPCAYRHSHGVRYA
jgi:hypothetical protein